MTQKDVWTVKRILNWTQQYFASKGLESPALDAEILLCDVLKCRRIDLFMRFNEPLVKAELDAYHECVVRRAGWEPLAYILGKQTFLEWDFKVTPAVLIPRPETELLVEKLVHYMTGLTLTEIEHASFWKKRAAEEEVSLEATAYKGVRADDDWKHPENPRILDIGTGSGAIVLSLLKLVPGAVAVAADISPDALAVARENAAELGLLGGVAADGVTADGFGVAADGVTVKAVGVTADGVTVKAAGGAAESAPRENTAVNSENRVKFVQTDIYSNIPADLPEERKFDIIVSNPPYIPDKVVDTLAADVKKEPRLALAGGADGLDLYRRIVGEAHRCLKKDGLLALEIGIHQGEALKKLAHEAGFTVCRVLKDYAGIDRMVFAAREGSPAAGWMDVMDKVSFTGMAEDVEQADEAENADEAVQEHTKEL